MTKFIAAFFCLVLCACGDATEVSPVTEGGAIDGDAHSELCCSTDAGLATCSADSFQCFRSRTPQNQCADGECKLGDTCEAMLGSGTVVACEVK